MHRYFKAEITENTNINQHFKLVSLHPLSEVTLPEAGQFYMLQTGDTYDPLLKRPFSIFKADANTLHFLYRVRGRGTQALAGRKKGDIVQVIGPVGNSYPPPGDDFIAVAGGIGIASLLPFLEKYPHKGTLFYGARNRHELVMLDEAKTVAKEVTVTTDDGSSGKKGLITESLNEYLAVNKSLPIYACGPTPMLKELHRIVSGRGIPCYVSLEEHMACGVGACLGCVVKVRDKSKDNEKTELAYKRVCKEGPIFNIEDIAW